MPCIGVTKNQAGATHSCIPFTASISIVPESLSEVPHKSASSHVKRHTYVTEPSARNPMPRTYILNPPDADPVNSRLWPS
eukprot:3532601-Rhodomonas_salina.1